ncbi:MAG: RNA polymerase subunit sigma [Gammaproteobacteria bacterium HGW-Gammaproteobacteria-3]|nr:MAG: RNA polymerase subunit sigma [Gammaproteobacteria bacterium HGW-Gammaproteobacteria-3]
MSKPEQWLGLYGDVLYRYALSRVRNPDVAEDLVQETLLAGIKAKDNYAGQAAVQTWLIGILKHKIIDYFRKASREKTQEFDDRFATEEDDYFDQQGSWQIDLSSWSKPDKCLEQEQFIEVLQTCIDRLPPRMAQLFILRELDGMESEKICETLSISTLNNFWVMMSRVRVQLRHCLDLNWFGKQEL